MQKETAVCVHGLSKAYKLYDCQVDRLKESVNIFRKKYHRDFYALHNINIDISRGECLGVIGKNGSGKSTLLKIITNVITPTTGTVTINGKISSLLELGVGFNPEMTGIENVYFNGAIMGYEKKEMDKKIDAIRSFADIGEFICQPLKTYSTGMQVRLAFAAAIQVDPDILIIDEALAVGDIRFQQKCYRKIMEFKEHGKTIILVTHDIGAVTNFCSRVLWLDNGTVRMCGVPAEICKRYMAYMVFNAPTHEKVSTDAESSLCRGRHATMAPIEMRWDSINACSFFGDGGATITKVAFYTDDPFEKVTLLHGGELVNFYMSITANTELLSPGIGLRLNDEYGNHVFSISSYVDEVAIRSFKPGETIDAKFKFRFPSIRDGRYTLTVAVADGHQTQHIQHHYVHDVYVIQVKNEGFRHTLGSVAVEKADYDIVYY